MCPSVSLLLFFMTQTSHLKFKTWGWGGNVWGWRCALHLAVLSGLEIMIKERGEH